MLTVVDFANRKKSKNKLTMITCYDFTMAKIINASQVDIILVGDSAAQIMHGQSSTLKISTEIMALHVSAVQRGAPKKMIVGDMPFLSYRKSLTANMNNMEKLMKAGAHALKIEGALGNLQLIKHAEQSGIPIMGHLGLTPQSVHTLGGYKVQGREKKAQQLLKEQSLQLQEAGCFSLVLECVPHQIAQEITQSLEIPVIGIGAGPDVDGQVLVLQDMLGMNPDFQPQFLRKYFNGHEEILKAVNKFQHDVAQAQFPNQSESYS